MLGFGEWSFGILLFNLFSQIIMNRLRQTIGESFQSKRVNRNTESSLKHNKNSG